MLTLSYSAEIFTLGKEFIGRAVVMSNTKDIAILAVDQDVFEELISELNIVFYDEIKGVVSTICSIIRYHTPISKRDTYTFTCKIMEVIDVLQRRADVYARLDMDIDLLKVKAIKDFQGQKSIHFEEKPVLARLKNISAGGMHFISEEEMKEGTLLSFGLNRLFDTNESVMMEILRTEEVENKKKFSFGYGCRFLNLTNSVESQIRQYVYQMNRNQLNNRKRHMEPWLY